MTPGPPILIVGHDGGTNIGRSLIQAAHALGREAELADSAAAYAAPRAIARVNWWLRGRRPTHLRAFSAGVRDRCRRMQPSVMIATGLAPIDAVTLRDIRAQGVTTVNFLTDDPWNPAFRSTWFLDALPFYDRVFSPRRSNIADLVRHGCSSVDYLPFGFDPALFFPEAPPVADRARYSADVFFAGGADVDRRPFIAALLAEGLTVALYGAYWDRYSETRVAARGHGHPQELRYAISEASVCLGLVRRVNRDGHAMRSIEVPAAGGCFLAERTDEHLEMFGPDDEAVTYFDDVQSMVQATARLVQDEPRRRRLAARGHAIIRDGAFTYVDRLMTLAGITDCVAGADVGLAVGRHG
jgi:hypothetical protein